MKEWATKSTALAAQTLMLGVRAYGYDSCPMEGFDDKRVRKILKLNSKAWKKHMTISKCSECSVDVTVLRSVDSNKAYNILYGR